MSISRFIYDAPTKNADLYYYTHFLAEDNVIFFSHKGKKYLVMSDLELDRAKKQANVDEVLSLSHFMQKAAKKISTPTFADVLHEIFSEKKIKSLEVPSITGFALVDALRKRGYKITSPDGPFEPARLVKNAEEKKLITQSQKVTFESIALARDILKRSKIKGRTIVYRGKILTSESLRRMIEVFLMEHDFSADQTIVASRPHSIDPHAVGNGPLRPHDSIILDIFPRSLRTRYYGDATRTFFKGRPSDALIKMYNTVLEAQKMALSLVRSKVVGSTIHEKVYNFFEGRGYHTGEKNGRMVGFFHGTGHSIGLEVHEEPARINRSSYVLQEGNITSVEPGLYYPEIGGVRIEDLVFVKKDGCEILSKFPKELEVL